MSSYCYYCNSYEHQDWCTQPKQQQQQPPRERYGSGEYSGPFMRYQRGDDDEERLQPAFLSRPEKQAPRYGAAAPAASTLPAASPPSMNLGEAQPSLQVIVSWGPPERLPQPNVFAAAQQQNILPGSRSQFPYHPLAAGASWPLQRGEYTVGAPQTPYNARTTWSSHPSKHSGGFGVAPMTVQARVVGGYQNLQSLHGLQSLGAHTPARTHTTVVAAAAANPNHNAATPTAPQTAEPQEARPEKRKPGRPQGSKDKNGTRNKKGEGLAKKPAYNSSGRPSNRQKDAAIKHAALKATIKGIEDEGRTPSPAQYAQLERLRAEGKISRFFE